MIQKFSVRKPFTVLVGVILVVVLGIVSFMFTSTDLLPAMDIPITAIFTTYIGATPEQVEQDVTIPLETRMSTLTGIDMVQSMSSEHVSVLILGFVDGTNMDSASLEIREALDMMVLPDGASRPMTIRMNPEMLPIMTANIFMENVEIDDLSDMVRYTVAPAIEGVPGVAVVSLSGLVGNQLNVIIDADMIDELTENIMGSVMAMISEQMVLFPVLVEAEVAARVEEFSAARMAELLDDEYTLEEAQMILAGEIAEISPVFMMEAVAELQAQFEGADMTDTDPGMAADMLNVDMIAGLLMAQNFSMPAGMIADGGNEYMIRVGERFESVEEIRNMLIMDLSAFGLEGLEPIRLGDVAQVFETDDAHLSFTRVNGMPAVMMSIQRQSEFPTSEIANAVRNRLDQLVEDHPGLGYAVLMDQGYWIDMIISSVLNNLLIGGLLAIVVIFLFLKDIRPTLVVAVSIPVSLLLAFTLMYFTGVNLNMISMGGLALSVGMLVDNSIVVIENIYRMRATTKRSAARSAVSGAKQVVGAIVASTLTTIAVFLPIVFTQGLTRQIFTDLGLTIAYSLLASLLVALTVVPAASSVLLKNFHKGQEGRLFTKFVDGYESALKVAFRFKWVVLLVAAAGFFISFWAMLARGTEMFPPMQMPQISVEAVHDATTFDDAVLIAEEVSERLLAIADIETVGVTVGGGGMMGMLGAGMGFGGMAGGQGTDITFYLIVGEDTTMSRAELNSEITRVGELSNVELRVMGEDGGLEMLTGAAVSIRVEGMEFDAIRDTATRLADIIQSVPGTTNVTDVIEEAAAEIRIIVDRDAAMSAGLTVAQVFMAANARITAPERTTNMMLGGRSLEIIIQDGSFVPPDLDDIRNMEIESPTGGIVLLSDIAEVTRDYGFGTITRMNRNRFLTVSADIAEGYNVGLVNNAVEAALQGFVPESCCTIVIGGQADAINDAFMDLLLMLLLALIFIYLIMVAQFQSLLAPFIIMFTIPLGFTGGFIALMIAGMPLSIISMIGLILLAGVVVTNGIVFISRINQMRWEGMPKKEAIIDAGRKRIRPILMTALSTIAAMSLMAVGFGDGTEMMQPMAIASIGGLAYATFMTLFVVPVLYDMFFKNKDITLENLDEDGDVVHVIAED